MLVPRRLALLCWVAITAALAPSQHAAPPSEPSLPADFALGIVPIHQARGIWAAGPTYKVSFHDGFALYTHGAEASTKPWRWRTISVRAGEVELLEPEREPAQHHTPRRFEYHHEHFVEAYDLREAGVEQTFVFARRPAVHGDLVVRGAIDTDLVAAATPAAAHDEVVFGSADPTRYVRYGAAFAVDAAGRKLPLRREVRGGEIALRVPASWLRTATFPVTIDPIIAGPAFRTGAVKDPRLYLEPYSEHRALVTFGLGTDSYAYLCRADLSDPRLIHAEIGSGGTSAIVGAAFVDAPRRWILVTRTPAGSPFDQYLRFYFHDAGNTTRGSGSWARGVLASTAIGSTTIAVGGTERGAAGDWGLIVFRGPVANPTIRAARIDARTMTVHREFEILGGPGETAVGRVTPSRGPTAPWLVTAERAILGTLVTSATAIWPSERITSSIISATPTSTRPLYGREAPLVETTDGEYVCATIEEGVLRFWRLSLQDEDLEVSELEHGLEREAYVSHLAWEPEAKHLCVIMYSGFVAQVVRLSRGMCEIDRERVLKYPCGLHYDAAGKRFVLASYHVTGGYLRGQWYTHDRRVGSAVYGDACLGEIEATTPYAASDCTISLHGAPPTTNALLLVSPIRYSTALGDGCYKHIDTSVLAFSAMRRTSALGSAHVTIPLPDCPVLIGQLNAQWFITQAGRTKTTAGLALYVLP